MFRSAIRQAATAALVCGVVGAFVSGVGWAAEPAERSGDKNASMPSNAAVAEVATLGTSSWQPLVGAAALERRKQRILRTVQAWAQAWSQQAFETYVSAYADNFPPSGRSHEIWLALRRQRVMGKASIRVQIVSPEVQLLSTERARVTFVQIYDSPSYSDRVDKVLILRKMDVGWRIVREASSPVG